MSIQQWPEALRPRERLLAHGAKQLSDQELVAIFLRTGVTGVSAVELADRLLDEFGSLRAMMRADMPTFCQQKGLGEAKYVQLQAVMELSRRCYEEDLRQSPCFSNSEAVSAYLKQQLQGLEQEVFACLFLNTQHQLIAFETLFYGTVNKAPVYPREIVKRSLRHNASAVILAHNHPSGLCEPSKADELITDEIVQALQFVDVRVLDHFIVAGRSTYSFAQHGLL